MCQLHVSKKMVCLFLGWKMLHNYFWGSRMDFHPIALLLCAIVPLAHVHNFFRESRMVYHPIARLFWRITVRHAHVYNFFWVFWMDRIVIYAKSRARHTYTTFFENFGLVLQSVHMRVRFFNPPTDVPTFAPRQFCVLLYRPPTDVPTLTTLFFFYLFF